MPRNYKPDPRSKRHISYNKDDIERALEDKRINNMSYRAAAAKHNIEYTVLFRHATRINVKKLGGQTVLGPDVENIIIDNMNTCSEWGYPMDQYDLRLLVKMYLDRKGVQCQRFKNNMPGVDFALGFLKRHKNKISERYAQNIKRARANVSADTINAYFNELETTLKDVPPACIINYDETNVTDDPGRKKVIVKRGSKYPERAMNTTKCSISLMMAGAANGHLFPPYVIYKAQHLYDLWKTGGPTGTRYNRTSSGWIDLNTFEDWINTIVIPYAKKQERTVFLIGDNLSCHLSLDAIKNCKNHNVQLVFLPPNSTHLTQPLDVAFFRPLKMAWREILLNWKKKEGSKEKSLPKSVFPHLLNRLYSKIEATAEDNLKSGFKKTGIFPLNREEVLSRLPGFITNENNDINIVSDSVKEMLKSMRYSEEDQPVKKKKKLDVPFGKSVGDEVINNSEKQENKPNKTQKNKGGKGACKNKRVKIEKIKEVTSIKTSENKTKKNAHTEVRIDIDLENEKNATAVSNNQVADIEPIAGPSNLQMCRICHCIKNRDAKWLRCNVCRNQICNKCTGDALPVEFICLRCFQVDSDDSAADEDYNPIIRRYNYDDSLSSD